MEVLYLQKELTLSFRNLLGVSLLYAMSKPSFTDGPTAGDTIGCGIDFTSYKTFFTKNGTLLGKNCLTYPSLKWTFIDSDM